MHVANPEDEAREPRAEVWEIPEWQGAVAANKPNGRNPPTGTVPATSTPHAKGRAEGTAEVAAEGSRECSLIEKRVGFPHARFRGRLPLFLHSQL